MKGSFFSLLCTAAALLMFSCTDQQEQERRAFLPPDSIIAEPVMVQLLADVHVLEAGLTSEKVNGGATAKYQDYCYNGLFKKYGVTRQRFLLNIRYYQWDEKGFHKLYDQVVDELDSRNNWFKGGKKEGPPPVQPSENQIKRVNK
ncbi:MAG TPA: DUF4296 domain-containing protein [Bacteroidales bacterium]|nr:DUF4296 domain-containing protein [Bacteroidales bacterium]HPS74225.1 DUF4296 domain-containing protein [Bacteroidales bacterium]